MTTTTYPLAPLAEALNIELGKIGGHTGRWHHGAPPEGHTALAEALGVTTRRIRQLANEGLSELVADRYASAIGRHPSWIWPNWWDEADPDLAGTVTRPCTCGDQQRPLGRICDRCGHDLPRRARRPHTEELTRMLAAS